jgi:hypothetical protein
MRVNLVLSPVIHVRTRRCSRVFLFAEQRRSRQLNELIEEYEQN